MDYNQAKYRRYLRKMYLDAKRQRLNSVTLPVATTYYMPTITEDVYRTAQLDVLRQNRLSRKTQIQNKRFSNNSNKENNGGVIIDTNNRYFFSPSSANPNNQSLPSDTQLRTPMSSIRNGKTPVNNTRHTALKISDTPSLSPSDKNYNLQSTPSTLQLRTPLSNITNGMSSSNYKGKTTITTTAYNAFFSNDTPSPFSYSPIQPSSSSFLPPTNPKQKRKYPNLDHLPIHDLTNDEEFDANVYDEEFYNDDGFVAISKEYIDHGDQIVKCKVCKAKLWKAESLRGKKRPNGSFSLCCFGGIVQLPDHKDAPPAYKHLFRSDDPEAKHFRTNIRRYNSMFSFTSLGGKVDKSINRGRGPYVFRLSGQNYHRLGGLIPSDGSTPKFSQLYIYDTDNEIANRKSTFSEHDDSTKVNDHIETKLIHYLKGMLDSHNELVKAYRMVRDCFHSNPEVDFKLRLIGRRAKDGRTFNLPTASEVAALIVGDFADLRDNRDVLVEKTSGGLQRINELHPSYIPLQYPILFPYGDDGYMVGILHRGLQSLSDSKRPTCTMREFFAYRIQDRDYEFSLILHGRRLFQQFLVDGYTMIESERLYFLRGHQKILRSDTYENLRKIQNEGTSNMSETGQRVILPSSFTGGARYMQQNYLDAMSLCKWFGYPDFFITFTCNPKWPEIRRFLKDKSLKAEDRPDILCRLFKIKLDTLMQDLKGKALLGKVQAAVYTIEFQKRGLPHSHICLFMHPDSKVRSVDRIDDYISAEIPDQQEDPELYSLVTEFMLHGPCGARNPKSPCMEEKKCSKNYPKKFKDHTSVDNEGFPVYRRRDNGSFIKKGNVTFDNRDIVPYNKHLLKRYQGHINIEWCNQSGSIKYLFKYINKGPDKTTLAIVRSNKEGQQEEVDEIQQHYDCRYLSACEASWRIFSYDVHYRTPSVIRLPFHLPGKQQVVYGAEDDIDDVLDKTSCAENMFLGWMNCNKIYEQARQLTYFEFPTKFVWIQKNSEWKPRESGFSIGRIHSVPPKAKDAYYLRILLNKVKGPTSFEDIRTVDGQIYPTFKDACYALGLLDDDNEYIECIKEASHTFSGSYLRSLFATMLTSDSLTKPEEVWNKTWEYLSDGILYHQRRRLKSPELQLSENQIKNLTLFEIEQILICNNSTLKQHDNMPYPDSTIVQDSSNPLITEQLAYENTYPANEVQTFIHSLTTEQRGVFNCIINAITNCMGGIYFVYGYGGTGKTFLWKTLSAAIRSKGKIVLNVASSGIASLLLNGGRTAHSRFHIPLNLTEDTMCTITPKTDLSRLLSQTSLIIWDEAPMIHKHAFEALDRTMRDVLTCEGVSNSLLPFGGKVVVFGGDFRQILPVINKGSRPDIVSATLCSSYLWSYCKVLRLTKNMRLTVKSDPNAFEKTKQFADWLLDVGEGNVGGPNHGEVDIDIPEDLLIIDINDPIGALIDFVYPSILQQYKQQDYFQERAILAPKHEVVHEINERLLSLFPGEEKIYLSSDSLDKTEHLHSRFDQHLYAPDVLNGMDLAGIPKHRLVLKVGVPIMLLRNIDQKNGLCNGTRLRVVALGQRFIDAVVMTGSNVGHRTIISRLSLTPTEKNLPFKFNRRQFPVSVCFAMTINKSQGQTLARVGLLLKEPVFTHGQLYVALSRVQSRDGLKILILNKDGSTTNKTTNVVYKEVFRNL